MNAYYADSLWVEAATDHEAEAERALMAEAKVAAAPILAFVSGAESETDFENRMALMEPNLHAVARGVAGEGTVGYTTIVTALPERLFSDWRIAHEARLAEAQKRNAPRAAARAEAREAAKTGSSGLKDLLDQGGNGNLYARLPTGVAQDLWARLNSEPLPPHLYDIYDSGQADVEEMRRRRARELTTNYLIGLQMGAAKKTGRLSWTPGYGGGIVTWYPVDKNDPDGPGYDCAVKPALSAPGVPKEPAEYVWDVVFLNPNGGEAEVAHGYCQTLDEGKREIVKTLRAVQGLSADDLAAEGSKMAAGGDERGTCSHCGKEISRGDGRNRRAWRHGTSPGEGEIKCADGNNVAEPRASRRTAAKPPSRVAGEGAYVTDPHDSSIRKEIAPGTVARPGQGYVTWTGQKVYDWTIDGLGDGWNLGGEWHEQDPASPIGVVSRRRTSAGLSRLDFDFFGWSMTVGSAEANSLLTWLNFAQVAQDGDRRVWNDGQGFEDNWHLVGSADWIDSVAEAFTERGVAKRFMKVKPVKESHRRTAWHHTAPGGGAHPPYEVEQRGDEWVVVNSKGEVKGTHESKEKAREQQKALYANVKGASRKAHPWGLSAQADLSGYWEAVDAQAQALRSAKTADEVLSICAKEPGVSVGDGWWGGDGDEFMAALFDAGWTLAWANASYHFAMNPPQGGPGITYTEGDIDRGIQRQASRRTAGVLEDAIQEHAESPDGTISVGDVIDGYRITDVGTHTIQYEKDGWAGSTQIPFVGPWGEKYPSLDRALNEASRRSLASRRAASLRAEGYTKAQYAEIQKGYHALTGSYLEADLPSDQASRVVDLAVKEFNGNTSKCVAEIARYKGHIFSNMDLLLAMDEATKTAAKTAAAGDPPNIALARKVLADGFYAAGGVLDQFSASAITQVYDALSAENKAKFGALPLVKMVEVAFGLINRTKASANRVSRCVAAAAPFEGEPLVNDDQGAGATAPDGNPPPATPGVNEDQVNQSGGGPGVEVATVAQGDTMLDVANGAVVTYSVDSVTDEGDTVLMSVTKDGTEQMDLRIPKSEQVQVLPQSTNATPEPAVEEPPFEDEPESDDEDDEPEVEDESDDDEDKKKSKGNPFAASARTARGLSLIGVNDPYGQDNPYANGTYADGPSVPSAAPPDSTLDPFATVNDPEGDPNNDLTRVPIA